MIPVITIDGPAGSGKSSVSREIASRRGWAWVSSGAFYRGLAYAALQTQTPLDDEDGLADLAKSDIWSVELSHEKTRVFFDGKEVTDEIYLEKTGGAASQVSQYPKVRKNLLECQRNCAIGVSGLVAEGRDCGTIIFPEAPLKIFLTASSESRASRRALQEGKTEVQEIQKAQSKRDALDTQRKTAPLVPANDAITVDTSHLDLVGVVQEVEQLVSRALGT